jgi:hypothetical protein
MCRLLDLQKFLNRFVPPTCIISAALTFEVQKYGMTLINIHTPLIVACVGPVAQSVYLSPICIISAALSSEVQNYAVTLIHIHSPLIVACVGRVAQSV